MKFILCDNTVSNYINLKDRTDENIIAQIEQPTYAGNLYVINVPDEATDVLIKEINGDEYLFYVLNGKIFDAVNG